MKMAPPKYKSVVERYFTPRYKTDLSKKIGEDICILTHTNRISLVTLAKSHPILQLKKRISAVNFQVDKQTNRLDNKVTGKGKRGAQNISINAALCHVSCEDGSQYTIHGGMKGSLVEVNNNLVSHPQLLTEKPNAEGYIAIILTHLQDHEATMDKLLTQDQYEQILHERQILQDRQTSADQTQGECQTSGEKILHECQTSTNQTLEKHQTNSDHIVQDSQSSNEPH